MKGTYLRIIPSYHSLPVLSRDNLLGGLQELIVNPEIVWECCEMLATRQCFDSHMKEENGPSLMQINSG